MTLNEVFEACPWTGKHHEPTDDPAQRMTYMWHEVDAEHAHSMLCSGILQEDTPVLIRRLYLTREKGKRLALYVTEEDKAFDIKEVAEKVAAMFDPSKIVWPSGS